MPGKMNVLDAHEANERRRADKMVEGVGDELAHSFERRKLLQREIVLLLAHLPIDALEALEVEPVLAAEIVVDQVLAGADALGDAIDAGAVEPVGGELILCCAQDELPAQHRVAPLPAAFPSAPQLPGRRPRRIVGEPSGLISAARCHQPTFAEERTAALARCTSVASTP